MTVLEKWQLQVYNWSCPKDIQHYFLLDIFALGGSDERTRLLS
jgi:hypothetical protein